MAQRDQLALDDDASPLGLRTRAGGYLLKAPLGGGEYLGFRYQAAYELEQKAVAATKGDAEPPY